MRYLSLLAMMIWSHFISSPLFLNNFGLLESDDIFLWVVGLIIINIFLFFYCYFNIFGNIYNRGKATTSDRSSDQKIDINECWDNYIFINSFIENIKLTFFSIFLLPRLQYFSFFCFDNETKKNWIFYTFYKQQEIVSNHNDFKLYSYTNSQVKSAQIIHFFNQCIKAGVINDSSEAQKSSGQSPDGQQSQAFSSTILSEDATLDQIKKSIQDALLISEYQLNTAGHSCNRNYFLFCLILAVFYLLAINIIPKFFDKKVSLFTKRRRPARNYSDDDDVHYEVQGNTIEQENPQFQYTQTQSRHQMNPNNTFHLDYKHD